MNKFILALTIIALALALTPEVKEEKGFQEIPKIHHQIRKDLLFSSRIHGKIQDRQKLMGRKRILQNAQRKGNLRYQHLCYLCYPRINTYNI